MKKARVGPLPGVTQDIAGFKVRYIQQHRGLDYAVVACFLMAKWVPMLDKL
uniref:GTP-binding family protein n=1 Tax=Solanum tuberosum TaxID=4113 RepID=M1C6U5_SOLTU